MEVWDLAELLETLEPKVATFLGSIPEFRHSEIWEAEDEAVLNKVL
jgi:hypothetical protein